MLLNKVSARYIYGPIMLHDGSATIHHGGATNAHDDAPKIRYGASMVQAGSATTFSPCCILDESEWIGMSVIPRFIPNAHKWSLLHLPHIKYEPSAATVEELFRQRPHNSAAPVAEWVRSLNLSTLNHSVISPL